MPTAEPVGRRRWLGRWAQRLLPALTLAATAWAGPHLTNLAVLDGASGPAAVHDYLQGALGDSARGDNTGSLSITFGQGEPHLLIAAGFESPGYAVSEITEQGYLRLQRLAEPPPNYQFDSSFLGRPVRVYRFAQTPLRGVVAAPSVHFHSERGYSSARQLDNLYVDIGASSRAEVEAAGVRILDRVGLESSPTLVGDGSPPTSERGPGWVFAAPYVSSYAGAALLLALADHFQRHPPAQTTTLAFVSGQHGLNAGLTRALRELDPEQAIVLRPGGGRAIGFSGASGYSSPLASKLLEQAKELDLEAERGPASPLSFGPFTQEGPLSDLEQTALMTLPVGNPNTPVEALRLSALIDGAALLAHAAGSTSDIEPQAFNQRNDESPRDPVPVPLLSSPLQVNLAHLVRISGVSGDEGRIREEIRDRTPQNGTANVDERGNLIVKLGPDQPPQAVFIAHMDEIGFAVSRAESSDGLRLEPRGGIDDERFAWQPLVFQLRAGPSRGWMSRFGSASIDPRSGAVEIGVTATIPKRYRPLLGSRINARSLDDRVGCAVLLDALNRLVGSPAGRAVWFVFSVDEEVGLLGAEALAERVSPARVYAVDSLVTSDSPLESTRIADVALGGGAVIRAMDSSGHTPRHEVERVVQLARRESIPLRVGITAGGNDGAKFTGGGAVNIPLSFPLRYSHTAAETADWRDIDALADLVVALAREELRNR